MTHDFDSSGGGNSDSLEANPQVAQPARTRQQRVPLPLAASTIVLIAAVVVALVLHDTAGTLTTSSQAVGASTATPSPKLLYEADWTHGTGGFLLPRHWHVNNGQLDNDGYGTEPVLIPYPIQLQDYSIAVDFTVQSIPKTSVCHSYGIEGLSAGNTLQFWGGIECIRHLAVAYHGFSENFVEHADSVDDGISTQDYTISYSLQTFIVRVQDHTVNFCPGAACLANRISTTPLWPIQIALYDIGVHLSVTRIIVTSL